MVPSPPTNKLRRYAAHAALVAICVAAAGYALWPTGLTDLEGEAAERRAQMDLIVKVPPYAKLEGINAPESIEVTPADISLGYVDVPEPSRLTVSFNTRQGFLLQLGFDDQWIQKMDISVDGRPSLIEQSGARIQVNTDIGVKRELELRYRLYLSRSMRPGNYAWPVVVSVSPPA